MASSSGVRLSREDWKKKKELEELRKSGAAPAELDEDGKMINPHIPQYIADAPWYLNNTKPGLKHQRQSKEGPTLSKDWYRRGEFAEKATKFRKGACANCGAMTHDQKNCLSRPRQRGAKWTNQGIEADEYIQELSFDYAGKRDRWNGYDNNQYKRIIEEWEKTELARRKRKEEEMQAQDALGTEEGDEQAKKKKRSRILDRGGEESDSDSETDDSDSDEDMKDKGEVIQKRDGRTRTTVRNLRIREDTVKYLRNVYSDAFYDPKTRSMRQNPFPDQDPNSVVYAGDNFVRNSGDVNKFQNMELFAWDAAEKGQQIHLASNPSLSELLFHQHKQKKEQMKNSVKKNILDKYGGEEHLHTPAKELLLAQTEQYVEYSADGRVIKGQEKAIPTSKYAEDVLENNHTSVWGSYWQDGRWGYACCCQTIRNAYCTGRAGQIASISSQPNNEEGSEDKDP